MKLFKLILAVAVMFVSYSVWGGDAYGQAYPKSYTKAGVTAWALESTNQAYACISGSDVEYSEQRFYRQPGDTDCSGLANQIATTRQEVVSSQPDKAQVNTIVVFYGNFGETMIGYNQPAPLEYVNGQWIMPEKLRNITVRLPDFLRVSVEVQGDIQYAALKVRDDNGNLTNWNSLKTGKNGDVSWVELPTKLLDKKGELQIGSTYCNDSGYHYKTKSYNLQDTSDSGEVVANPSGSVSVENFITITDSNQWTWYIDTNGTGVGEVPLFQHTLTKATKVKIGASNDLGKTAKSAYVRRIDSTTPGDWQTINFNAAGYIEVDLEPGKYQLIFDEENFLRGPGPDYVDPYWVYGDAMG